jgi:hypothetical protein
MCFLDLVASGHGLEVARWLGGALAACHSPHTAASPPGPSGQVASRRALGPASASNEGWLALRRAGAWLLRARGVVPVIGRRW